jgi:3-phenylpropionate/cinnamic acid dioxygenase small subunit
MASIEDRLRALEDRAEIQAMLSRYGRCLDTSDWDGFRALFADDIHAEHGVVTPPLDGLDTFIAAAQALSCLMEDCQHYVTNPEVEIDGDDAKATAFVFAMHDVILDGKRQLVPAGGRYEDWLRRTDDGWKIYRLIVHETWLDDRVEKIYAPQPQPA